jgi:hydroxyacylglutathione hydrolase
MIVERIWAANELRNYHYLLVDPDTGEALAIDPLDWKKCLDRANEKGYRITQILNTHEHNDHIAGNQALVEVTGAKVLAHAGAAKRIGGVDQGLGAGSRVRIGRHIELECLDTPGHTFAHLCLLAHAEQPALFSGDTLFNAGVGHCRDGDPNVLFDSCRQKLLPLPGNTRVYPGHDYLLRNLAFTLNVEPGNQGATQLKAKYDGMGAEEMPILTLADELEINGFFRLESRDLQERVRELVPTLSARPEPREVFVALRELRNHW